MIDHVNLTYIGNKFDALKEVVINNIDIFPFLEEKLTTLFSLLLMNTLSSYKTLKRGKDFTIHQGRYSFQKNHTKSAS